MKAKNLFLSILPVVGVFTSVLAQPNTITPSISGNTFVVILPQLQVDFNQPIRITKPEGVTNFTVKKVSSNIADPQHDAATGAYTIDVTEKTNPMIKVALEGDNMQSLPLEITNSRFGKDGTPTASAGALDYLAKTIPQFNSYYRYDRKRNLAFFFFDENGMLLGPAPVNIDADDFIELYIAVPESSASDYSLEMVGEYNPSDLAIRPYTPIPAGAAQGTGEAKESYTYIRRTFGPFTSENAQIKIYGPAADGKRGLINQISVRINTLYNVGIGASFVSTSLANPDFDVFPLNGTSDNTIRKINDGKRTMVTFNVIYYWKPTLDWISGKLRGSSHVTRGRDVLKEATFWERLNPVFGVAMSSKWNENFFLGGNFEFARGGSISAGWHYGKVQLLADPGFQLAQDTFSGTKADIKLADSWKWNTFIGVTVDTRIFNALFTHN